MSKSLLVSNVLPAEALALMCIDEIEFTGPTGHLVPVAKPNGVAVPQRIAGIGVAVDEALTQFGLQLLVGAEKAHSSVDEP